MLVYKRLQTAKLLQGKLDHLPQDFSNEALLLSTLQVASSRGRDGGRHRHNEECAVRAGMH